MGVRGGRCAQVGVMASRLQRATGIAELPCGHVLIGCSGSVLLIGQPAKHVCKGAAEQGDRPGLGQGLRVQGLLSG